MPTESETNRRMRKAELALAHLLRRIKDLERRMGSAEATKRADQITLPDPRQSVVQR